MERMLSIGPPSFCFRIPFGDEKIQISKMPISGSNLIKNRSQELNKIEKLSNGLHWVLLS